MWRFLWLAKALWRPLRLGMGPSGWQQRCGGPSAGDYDKVDSVECHSFSTHGSRHFHCGLLPGQQVQCDDTGVLYFSQPERMVNDVASNGYLQ